MNVQAAITNYKFEMARFRRTKFQSLVAPIITTSLYFVVFGAAIGSKIETINGVSYGSFIVPGLIMLYLMTESINNAAFGIYFPKFVGSIFEVLSAPVSSLEATIGYVGAAASKSTIIGLMIFLTSNLFVTHDIKVSFDYGFVYNIDSSDVLTFWFYNWHLGTKLGEAKHNTHSTCNPISISWRKLLLYRHVTGVLAKGISSKSCFLPY